jgi:heptosyltransferase-2
MSHSSNTYNRILVIQTAFIGDAILATALIESLYKSNPFAKIDILIRKGNETLFEQHPFLNEVIVWDKKKNKHKNLLLLLIKIRTKRYDVVINLQRFGSTGVLTALSGAKVRVGFDKNPFSFLFSKSIKHSIIEGMHEVDRNFELISWFTDKKIRRPKLYPSISNNNRIAKYTNNAYICVAPNSVWFTKQFPEDKWIDLINGLPAKYSIYLLGAPGDKISCERIKTMSQHSNAVVLAGKLSFLDSAALMAGAIMNYVNDSAPMHIASAMNAPVAAIFCSTIPAFGFGPLSDRSYSIETPELLACRPCGLHGKSACPEVHFNCGNTIQIAQLLQVLN